MNGLGFPSPLLLVMRAHFRARGTLCSGTSGPVSSLGSTHPVDLLQVPPRQEELSVVRDRVSISFKEHRAKQPTGMTSHPSLEQPGMVVDACSPIFQEVETRGLS